MYALEQKYYSMRNNYENNTTNYAGVLSNRFTYGTTVWNWISSVRRPENRLVWPPRIIRHRFYYTTGRCRPIRIPNPTSDRIALGTGAISLKAPLISFYTPQTRVFDVICDLHNITKQRQTAIIIILYNAGRLCGIWGERGGAYTLYNSKTVLALRI